MEVYRANIEPSYEEIGDDLAIKPGGILVRKGLYRNAQVGAQYEAKTLARPDDDDCVFCEHRLVNEQEVIYKGERFAAFLASAPYEFMGDHPIEEYGHELVVPLDHTEDPRAVDPLTAAEIEEYMHDRSAQQPTITYVRNQGNPSKSVPHLHHHSIAIDTDRKVARYAYSWQEGVTDLTFELATANSGDELEDEIITTSSGLTIARPGVPFAHFDGQEVISHLRVSYDSQDPKSVATMREQLATMEQMTPPNQCFQTYTASTRSDCGTVEVLRLGLNPVYKIEFDRQSGGISELVFARLSLETITRINRLRQMS